MVDSGMTEETLDLREYLAVLRRRKWSILLVTVLVVGAALAFSLSQTPLYTARAKVLVAGPVGTFINLETEREVAGSQPVADLVREDLRLDRSVEALLAGIDVTGITETEVLEIAYTSPDPTEAQGVSNAFAENYLEHRRREALEILVADQEALQQRIDNASEQLTELSSQLEAAEQTQDQALATTLETQRSVMIARLGVLQQQLDDMQTRRTSALPRGQVIEVAQLPTAPSSPNHASNGILAALLGLALGVGLAFLRERLDDRFRGKADLERVIEAPVIGTIPRFRPVGKGKTAAPIATAAPRGPAAEAYRGLRTNVQFLALQRGLKSLLITSPSAHEGKTMTTVNLAAVMAQAGSRVILVSADLRRPTLEEHFGPVARGSEGLSSWLISSGDDLSGALQDPEIPNMRILPAGTIPPNPAELLTSPRLGALVELLEANCDFVLIDSPPVLAVADASILASVVGGTLLVVDGRNTHRTAALHARQEIERVGGLIVGTVLNSFDPNASPYYYGPYNYYGSEGLPDASGNGGNAADRRGSRKTRVPFKRG
jgi:capsular exopolysaccharide synthesis family protein